MTRRRSFDAILLVLVVVGALLVSWVKYADYVNPHGLKSVVEYWQRFGEPRAVTRFTHDGRPFFWVTGKVPDRYILALPSDGSAYIFTEGGELEDWCYDPGENQSFGRKWSRTEGQPIAVEAFKAHMSLQAK